MVIQPVVVFWDENFPGVLPNVVTLEIANVLIEHPVLFLGCLYAARIKPDDLGRKSDENAQQDAPQSITVRVMRKVSPESKDAVDDQFIRSLPPVQESDVEREKKKLRIERSSGHCLSPLQLRKIKEGIDAHETLASEKETAATRAAHLKRCQNDPFYACMLFPDCMVSGEDKSILSFFLETYRDALMTKWGDALRNDRAIQNGFSALLDRNTSNSIRFFALCWLFTVDNAFPDMMRGLIEHEEGTSIFPVEAFDTVVQLLESNIIPERMRYGVNTLNVKAMVEETIWRVQRIYGGDVRALPRPPR